MDGRETWTVRQASSETGVSSRTIRKYCNSGLIPGIQRGRNGYRILREEQMEQLRLIVVLEKCGFTIPDMKGFIGATPEIQKAILNTKRQQIWQKIDDMRTGIDFIERRIEILDADSRT